MEDIRVAFLPKIWECIRRHFDTDIEGHEVTIIGIGGLQEVFMLTKHYIYINYIAGGAGW